MNNLNIDPPEYRERLVSRINEKAAGLGFAFPRRPARAEPMPEERVRYWAGQAEKALAEDRAAGIARDPMDDALSQAAAAGREEARKYADAGNRVMAARNKPAPSARTAPPRAPRPVAATGPSEDEVKATALRLGISESQAREALTAPLSPEDLAFCEKHNMTPADFSKYRRKE